jgi:hypothetical protein
VSDDELITRAQRAHLAAGLKRDEAFNLFVGEIERQQTQTFLNPTASPEELNEAHSVIRALNLIASHIDRQITEIKMQERREERKHRAND